MIPALAAIWLAYNVIGAAYAWREYKALLPLVRRDWPELSLADVRRRTYESACFAGALWPWHAGHGALIAALQLWSALAAIRADKRETRRGR